MKKQHMRRHIDVVVLMNRVRIVIQTQGVVGVMASRFCAKWQVVACNLCTTPTVKKKDLHVDMTSVRATVRWICRAFVSQEWRGIG